MRRSLVFSAIAAIGTLLFVGALAVAVTGGRGPISQDRQTVPAPIDGLEVRALESSPPQYMLSVKAGLPSGCAQKHSHQISRSGDTITVTVLNSMPTGDPICTMIYGTYELNVGLGSDFRSGLTYTVQVNDKVTTFRAQ